MIGAGDSNPMTIATDGSTPPVYAGNEVNATGDSGLAGVMGANLAFSGFSVGQQIVGGIFSYMTNKTLMEAARDQKMEEYGHQDRMNSIQTGTNQYIIAKKAEEINIRVEGNPRYLKSLEKKAASEGDLNIAKEQVKAKRAEQKDLQKFEEKFSKNFGRLKYPAGVPTIRT